MSSRVRFERLLVLAFAAATLSCGGGLPAAPSPITSAPPAGATSSVAPTDYHEPPPPTPTPDPVAPAAMTINIVGSAGTGAFVPNPMQVAIGSTIVWTNSDAVLHQIVLDNGTMVGAIAPGQSSAPVTVSVAPVTYHCLLHPSMVGSIHDPSVPAPAPPPPPDYSPPPDDGYGRY